MNTVMSLWHDRPAGQDWNRAYPLGSGRLGAMVFGNVAHELLLQFDHGVPVSAGSMRYCITPQRQEHRP